jgi:hypothetical protein
MQSLTELRERQKLLSTEVKTLEAEIVVKERALDKERSDHAVSASIRDRASRERGVGWGDGKSGWVVEIDAWFEVMEF